MKGKFLLAPTERDLADKLGNKAIVSSLPETKGADVLYFSASGLYGMQRKAVPHDFIKSVLDGRIAKECPLLLQGCTFQEIILEGKFRYYADGKLASGVRDFEYRFFRPQIEKIKAEIKFIKGVHVMETADIDETTEHLMIVASFFDVTKHEGLTRRPKAQGAWGTASDEEKDMWILQSFDGVGVTTARSIRQSFGCVPLKWACDREDLLLVPGIKKPTVEAMWNRLPLSGTDVKVSPT